MFRRVHAAAVKRVLRLTAQNFDSGIRQKESRTLVSPALKHAAVFSDSEEMNGRKGQMPNLADANPWPPAICSHHNCLLQVPQYSKPCSHH